RVEFNWSRGARAIRLYEMGTVFGPVEGSLPKEEIRLAALVTGPRHPPHWSAPPESFDIWDAKGLARDVAELLGLTLEAVVKGEAVPTLVDPSAGMVFRASDGAIVGVVGQVAKSSVDAPAWAEPLWMLEVR